MLLLLLGDAGPEATAVSADIVSWLAPQGPKIN
jgi:hypothetical protein